MSKATYLYEKLEKEASFYSGAVNLAKNPGKILSIFSKKPAAERAAMEAAKVLKPVKPKKMIDAASSMYPSAAKASEAPKKLIDIVKKPLEIQTQYAPVAEGAEEAVKNPFLKKLVKSRAAQLTGVGVGSYALGRATAEGYQK